MRCARLIGLLATAQHPSCTVFGQESKVLRLFDVLLLDVQEAAREGAGAGEGEGVSDDVAMQRMLGAAGERSQEFERREHMGQDQDELANGGTKRKSSEGIEHSYVLHLNVMLLYSKCTMGQAQDDLPNGGTKRKSSEGMKHSDGLVCHTIVGYVIACMHY